MPLLFSVFLFQFINLCYGEDFLFCKLNDPNSDQCLVKAIETTLLRLGSDGEDFLFCKLNDPNSDQCLVKAIETTLLRLGSGFLEYGLEKLEPLSVSDLSIESGTGAVHLVQYYKNVKVFGYSKCTVKNAHFDKKNKILTWAATYPEVIQKADYSLSGNLLAIPIAGNGTSTTKLEHMEFTCMIKFEDYKKDGKTHFRIKSLLVTITPKNVIFKFENLFNENKLLGDNMNKLLNEEWQVIYNDVKLPVEVSYGNMFKKYAQAFFDKVPVEKMFPN